MQLIYFHGRVANFGDELNPVIWPRLAPDLFGPDAGSQEGAPGRTGFLGIGTIIGMPTPGCDFLHVFSSGMGYDRLEGWSVPRRVWCVRGPLSARLLGLDADAALTDGAVLVPAVLGLGRPAVPAGGIGVMPHWESLLCGGWEQASTLAGMRLCSPIGEPEAVIRRILDLDLLLTESLHGAILADAFGVPWVPFASSGNFSVFKWTDWTLSVGLSPVVAGVPPPDAAAVLRFGRPAPALRLDAEAAAADFHGRSGVGHHPATTGADPRALLKRALLSLPGATRLVPGFGVERTAAALGRLATGEPQTSRAGLRDGLADRMQSRLQELRREIAP